MATLETAAGPPAVLSVAEAAAILGVSPSTLRRRGQAGHLRLDARTPMGALAVTRAELNRHAATHRPDRGGRPAATRPEAAQRARDLRARGLSYARVGAELDRDGIPTAHQGRRWWPSAVRALLRRDPGRQADP